MDLTLADITPERFDAMEREILRLPAVDIPVYHHFTPGLYTREMHAPAGAVITSKIHKTRHPFMLLRGRVRVRERGHWVELAAPCMGFTEPGTRRVAVVLEDIVWVTCHVTNETDVDKIEAAIIEPRTAHLVGIEQPRHSPAALAALAGVAP